MTYEPSNSDLYSLIHKLYDKIENLEKKIDTLSTNRELNIDKSRRKLGLNEPDIYTQWVSFIKVEPSHYENLFLINGGIENVFKDIVKGHIGLYSEIPLYKQSNKLYVYHLNDTAQQPEWEPFNETHLSLLVTEVWRKTLGVQLNEIKNDSDDIEIKDQKRRIVIQFRQKILNVKKTRTNILKWLKEII